MRELQKTNIEKILERLEYLKFWKSFIGISDSEELELRNLEVKLLQEWSNLKD